MDSRSRTVAAPLERQLRQLIAHFDVLYRRLMVTRPATAASEVEISRQESRVLVVLGSKGTTIMSDLARASNLALSTATNTVDKLVSKELIERTRVEQDRRIVQVALSGKGRRLYEAFVECQLAMGRTMLEALSPGEREIFLELMAKMTQPRQSSTEPELERAVSSF
ncbi:MAG TPA: MarR family transcriptional regulator [Bryobacteraceae bacterium]|nr:MarR family transcriptional regulator [Bryobacteraceae bacterium]